MSLFPQRPKHTAIEVGKVEPNVWPYDSALHYIHDLIFSRKAPLLLEGTAEDVLTSLREIGRFGKAQPVRIGRVATGAVVRFTNPAVVDDFAHTLVVPRSYQSDVRYIRETIDSNNQIADPQPLRLSGSQEMATHDILPHLQFCIGALSVEAAFKWEYATIAQPPLGNTPS